MEKQIPKVIHYCWFGGNPIPERDKQCIASWSRFCPDYQIIEWNESNYDVQKNSYMRTAYENGKWGFVPDYARLDIIYEHGGYYLDTDVELLKPLSMLQDCAVFLAAEQCGAVNLGLGFGAIPHSPIIGELRSLYDSLEFIHEDGTLNCTPSPKYVTDFLLTKGYSRSTSKRSSSSIAKIGDMSIYPWSWFDPMDYDTGKLYISQQTYSIHHYHASWVSNRSKARMARKRKAAQLFGEKYGFPIASVLNFPSRILEAFEKRGIINAISHNMKKLRFFRRS